MVTRRCGILLCFLGALSSGYAPDPHESISRRTPSGVPYYLERVSLPEKSFFTTTGLILVEYEVEESSLKLIDFEEGYHHKLFRGKQDKMKYSEGGKFNEILESCQLGGDIFGGSFQLSNESRQQFYDELEEGCFFDKKLQITGLNFTEQLLDLEHSWHLCKSKRMLSESLLNPELLLLELEKLEGFISPDFKLSLSPADISEYYQEPLSSCVFTQEGNSFLLAIQIPLLSNSELNSIESHKLTPIPLWMPSDQNTVCHLQDGADPDFPEGTYLMASPNGNEVVREEDASLCPGHHLCPLPNPHGMITKRSMRRSCVQAIMETSADEDIACTLKCEPSGTFNFPIIRKVASDRYLIVGDLRSTDELGPPELRVECPPFQKEEVLTFPNTGALEIILPCDCHIRYGREIFKSGGEAGSCGAEFSKVPINFPGNFDIREVVHRI